MGRRECNITWKGIAFVNTRDHVWRQNGKRLGVANFEVFLHPCSKAGVLRVVGTGHPELGDGLVAWERSRRVGEERSR